MIDIKLMLPQRDCSNGDVLVIYEDGREDYISLATYKLLTKQVGPPMPYVPKNPCGEIAGGPSGLVQPWVQVQCMNHFRVQDGKTPYTARERELILDSLAYQQETGDVG